MAHNIRLEPSRLRLAPSRYRAARLKPGVRATLRVPNQRLHNLRLLRACR